MFCTEQGYIPVRVPFLVVVVLSSCDFVYKWNSDFTNVKKFTVAQVEPVKQNKLDYVSSYPEGWVNGKPAYSDDLVMMAKIEAAEKVHKLYAKMECIQHSISMCSSSAYKFVCPNDGHITLIRRRCLNVWHTDQACVEDREFRTLKKITPYFKNHKKVLMIVLGSNRLTRKELCENKNKCIASMRKIENKDGSKRYPFACIGVYDIGFESFEKTGELYRHWHLALLVDGINPTKYLEDIQRINKKVCPDCAISLGKSKETGTYWHESKVVATYFAKRHAGVLGHKNGEGEKLYPDVMSLKHYAAFESGKRRLYISPAARLIYNPLSESVESVNCPICDAIMQYKGIVNPETDQDYIKQQNGKKPPD